MTYPTAAMSEEDVAPYRVSMAPSSIYSRDDEPIRLTTTPPILFQQQPSTAHPAFAIDGPIVKPSRLPLFQQARSKLTRKPSKPVTPSSSTHWDELSGEPSSTGKPSQVKPSTYTVRIPFARICDRAYRLAFLEIDLQLFCADTFAL